MKARPLMLMLLVLGGCSQPSPTVKESQGQDENHAEEGHAVLDQEQVRLAGIETAPVISRSLQATLDVPGVVNATTKGHAVVTPPVAGRVVSIEVALGDTVHQGQVLATLESPELAQAWSSIADAERNRDAASASLKEAKSEVDLAVAKQAAAQANLARQRDLANAGAFSQAPLQQAQSELHDAQSELLFLQKEQASHADVVRRLENLYRDGIVSRSDLEAARLELQQDQIRLERANARVANAKATFDREKNIASRGLLNDKELQVAEAEVKSSQIELDRARIRVRSAEAALANATKGVANTRATYQSTGAGRGSVGRVALTAPISGTVTRLAVTKGQAVDRTQAIMTVEDLASVWVTANVPEADSAKVAAGASVRVSVAALPKQSFQGVVQVVGSRIEAKTRTVPVQCLVAGAAGALKPEMFATVHIASGPSEQAVSIPKTALVKDAGKAYVFVRHDDGYERVEIETGQDDGDHVAVKGGLKVGDVVVTKGGFVLQSELKKDELKGHEH